MKSKLLGICELVLISIFFVFAGKWFLLYGNPALMVMHCMFAALFFYYLPIVIFKRGDYRLVSYMLEIMLSFVLFLWLYLNGTNEIKALSDIAWAELLMFDSAFVLVAGLGGALVYATSTHN